MKLEYLAAGSKRCPLVRLYGFDQEEARNLRQLVRSLSSESRQEVSLNEKPWIESIGGCYVEFRVGDGNEGIRQCAPLNFECVLTQGGWKNVEGLLDPFCESASSGYQWLVGTGKISLLLSHNGQW
jgi:hypothetical protein